MFFVYSDFSDLADRNWNTWIYLITTVIELTEKSTEGFLYEKSVV